MLELGFPVSGDQNLLGLFDLRRNFLNFCIVIAGRTEGGMDLEDMYTDIL